jgi:DNA-binding NarL/FixJ family response regulator
MKEVGSILKVSEKTVMLHKYHIISSYNLKSNAGIVLVALSQGLIQHKLPITCASSSAIRDAI